MAFTMLALILALSFSLHVSAQSVTATNDSSPGGTVFELEVAMSDHPFTLNPLTDRSKVTVSLNSPNPHFLANLHPRQKRWLVS